MTSNFRRMDFVNAAVAVLHALWPNSRCEPDFDRPGAEEPPVWMADTTKAVVPIAAQTLPLGGMSRQCDRPGGACQGCPKTRRSSLSRRPPLYTEHARPCHVGMQFCELLVGARFRFFQRGTLLTKSSRGGYTTPGAAEQKATPDVEVISEEDVPALAKRAPAKPDDLASISKALDDLEVQAGKTAELAAARQALRRLDALSRLKSGGG